VKHIQQTADNVKIQKAVQRGSIESLTIAKLEREGRLALLLEPDKVR